MTVIDISEFEKKEKKERQQRRLKRRQPPGPPTAEVGRITDLGLMPGEFVVYRSRHQSHTRTKFFLSLGHVVAVDSMSGTVILGYWTNEARSFQPHLPFMPYRLQNGGPYLDEVAFADFRVVVRHVKLDSSTGCLSTEVQRAVESYVVDKARFRELDDYPGLKLPCPWVRNGRSLVTAATGGAAAASESESTTATEEEDEEEAAAAAGPDSAALDGLQLLCDVIEAGGVDEEDDERAAVACVALRQSPPRPAPVALDGPPSY